MELLCNACSVGQAIILKTDNVMLILTIVYPIVKIYAYNVKDSPYWLKIDAFLTAVWAIYHKSSFMVILDYLWPRQ